MRHARLLGVTLGAAAALAFTVAGERDASACGGDFTTPPFLATEVESVITDHKMILSISKDQTTFYDEVIYTGAPASFAWVLPIKGTVTVGLSADILFATLEQLTATEVVQPPQNCPPPPVCNGGGFFGGGGVEGAVAVDAGAGGPHSVTVLGQAQVGPYQTVQLRSTDGSALAAWLKSNGYRIPAADMPIIDAYVADHFDFLAVKLVPGKGVHAMQPIRVTSTGVAPYLPLHMIQVGMASTMSITVWVVGNTRFEPQNYPTFKISDSELAWDWTTGSSNYETLRLSKDAAFNGTGWQIESSLEVPTPTLRNSVLNNLSGSTAGGYAPPSDPSGPTKANEDLDILLAGVTDNSPRITRMRSDMAHSTANADMSLTASTDQSTMTNLLHPQRQIGQPQCPIFNGDCAQIGTAPRDQAIAVANGGGCATTPRESGSRTTVALALGIAGIAVTGLRRRRRARRS